MQVKSVCIIYKKTQDTCKAAPVPFDFFMYTPKSVEVLHGRSFSCVI